MYVNVRAFLFKNYYLNNSQRFTDKAVFVFLGTTFTVTNEGESGSCTNCRLMGWKVTVHFKVAFNIAVALFYTVI